jgi:hypothetical protein
MPHYHNQKRFGLAGISTPEQLYSKNLTKPSPNDLM